MVNILLPDKPNIPSNDLSDYKIVICGAKKVGKTTLANSFPNAFTFEFEVGNANHLPIRFVDIKSLDILDQTIAQLEKKPDYADTIIVDNPQILYEMICENIIVKRGVEDIAELSHGRGWGEAGKTFRDYCRKFESLGKGTIYTCHYWPETVDQGERKNRVWNTNLGRQANKFLDESVHMWWLYEFSRDGKFRFLKLKGTNEKKAGSGLLDRHFKHVDSKGINMGNDPSQLYSKLMYEFTNRETVEEIVEL